MILSKPSQSETIPIYECCCALLVRYTGRDDCTPTIRQPTRLEKVLKNSKVEPHHRKTQKDIGQNMAVSNGLATRKSIE